jgi:hypothetical protein
MYSNLRTVLTPFVGLVVGFINDAILITLVYRRAADQRS